MYIPTKMLSFDKKVTLTLLQNVIKIYLNCIKVCVCVVMVPWCTNGRILRLQNGRILRLFLFVCLIFPSSNFYDRREKSNSLNVSVVDDHLQLFLEVERNIRDCFSLRRFFRVLSVLLVIVSEGLFYFFCPPFLSSYSVICRISKRGGILICVM